jgi:O-antigen/teichoic acid export membrane protein
VIPSFKIKNFRGRRVFLTFLSVLGNKGVTVIVGFISLPLTLNYLGEERYGMMATIVSFLALMSFADFGLGYGLQNRIPEFEKNETKLKEAISSTFFFLLMASVVLAAIFFLVYPYVSWHKIFNVKSDLAIQEASESVLALFLCLIINIPISIVTKVQGGFQEGYFNNIWLSIGNVLGLGLLFLAVSYEMGVSVIILAIYGANTLGILLNFLNQFLRIRFHLLPKFGQVNRDVLRIIVRDGVYFTFIQILFAFFNASDNIIISQTLGAEKVASLAIGLRLIALLSTPMHAIMAPSLPAINDAIDKNDRRWVNKLFTKGLVLSILSTFLLSLLFFLFANLVITYWLGSKHVLSASLILAFSFYLFFYNLNPFFSYFMMTKPLLKKLSLIYPIAVLVAIGAKIVVCSLLGIPGLLVSTTLIMIGLFFLPSYFSIKKIIL